MPVMPYTFGNVEEGTTDAIGIEQQTSPAFRACCRPCGYRGTFSHGRLDAERDLRWHLKEGEHLHVMMQEAAREFERTLYA